MKLRILGLVMIASIGYLRGETDTAVIDPDQDQKMLALKAENADKGEWVTATSLMSQHMWRGFESGSAPTIEPYLAWRNRNFSLNAWAGYALNGSYREFDIFATYTWKNFTIGLFDYYCPEINSKDNRFLSYRNDETRHLIEWQIQYDGGDNFPLQLLFGQFIHGFDMDENQEQHYSMYLEMAYSWMLHGAKIKIEIGMSPANGMYANKASVFNYGFSLEKKLQVTETYKIPVRYKLIYNKETNDLHFSVSLQLN